MSDPNDLTTLVPQGLIRRLKDHFREKVNDAVAKYHLNAVDEDCLTGALGQELSTASPIVASVGKGTVYSFAIESYKILGKGPGTPEKRTGADGIMQITVESNGTPLYAKGLPFQAKKLHASSAAKVAKQAADMLRTAESGMILRFGPQGYDAQDARHLASIPSDPKVLTPRRYVPLHELLGDWFLKCQIGRKDLTFDRKAPDPNVKGAKGFWVISTKIIQTADPSSK